MTAIRIPVIRTSPPRRMWDVADQEIRRYDANRRRAMIGECQADPFICSAQIDLWLDLRVLYGPGDLEEQL